jgi:hypothetical protein
MPTVLRLKNDLDVLQVCLRPFFCTRLVFMELSTVSRRRSVRNPG